MRERAGLSLAVRGRGVNPHALSDFRNDPSVDIDDAKRLTQKARIDTRTQKDVWLATSQDDGFGSNE